MSLRPKKIFLIDDNPDDLFLNRIVIEKSKHPYEVVEYIDSTVALEIFSREEEDFDRILLLDINMPKLGGFEFLKRYRTARGDAQWSDRIVILTTSLHRTDKERAGQEDLVDCYMNKPLTLDGYHELIASLDKADAT